MKKDEFFISLKEIEIKFGIAINDLIDSEKELNDALFKTEADIFVCEKTIPVATAIYELLLLYLQFSNLKYANIE